MDGLFSPPPLISGLLGPQEAERLRKQSIGTGIVSALIGGLAAAPQYRYGGIAPILGQALQSGFQGVQGTYSSALENYQTQQKIAEAKRQKEQQRLREEAISKLPADMQSVALIDPNSFAELFKYQMGIGRTTYEPITAAMRDELAKSGVKLDPRKNYQMNSVTRQIVEVGDIGGPKPPSLSTDDVALINRLQWSPDPLSWTAEQADVWYKIKNAPDAASRARLVLDAARTKFETGTGAQIPRTGEEIIGNLFPLTGQRPQVVAGVPQTPVPQTPVASAISPQTAIPNIPNAKPTQTLPSKIPEPKADIVPGIPLSQVPAPIGQPLPETEAPNAFSQVSPKQREQLILDRPRAEQALSSVVGKTQDLNEVVTSLLKNKKGLARATGLSSKIPSIPGSAAYQAQSDLVNIKTRLATRALQEMRDLSKTGGAVGQITEREWPRLEQEFANLDAAQNMKAVESSLKKIQGILQRWRTSSEKAFVQTYGTNKQVSQTPLSPQGLQTLSPEQKDALIKKYIGR